MAVVEIFFFRESVLLARVGGIIVSSQAFVRFGNSFSGTFDLQFMVSELHSTVSLWETRFTKTANGTYFVISFNLGVLQDTGAGRFNEK